MQEHQISAAFPYQSHYVDIYGSKMHYIDEGQGAPILFIHGVPTSSYTWRNVIPFVSSNARCIALDLIGMGKSDKPDIEYSIFDHIKYVEKFIETLGLDNITIVMHAWGSLIGFDYAMRHQDKIAGLAFLESHVRANVDWDMLSLPVQEIAKLTSSEDQGFEAVIKDNILVEKILPSCILRNLSKEEIEHYQQPFLNEQDRKPLFQFLKEVPLGGGDEKVLELIANYSSQLQASSIPKLMFYAMPGFTTTIATVKWVRDHLPNTKIVDIGDALHIAQESNPKIIGETLLSWYQENVLSSV